MDIGKKNMNGRGPGEALGDSRPPVLRKNGEMKEAELLECCLIHQREGV